MLWDDNRRGVYGAYGIELGGMMLDFGTGLYEYCIIKTTTRCNLGRMIVFQPATMSLW